MSQSRCTNVVIPTGYCTLLSSIWEIAHFFADLRYPQFSSTKPILSRCKTRKNPLPSAEFSVG